MEAELEPHSKAVPSQAHFPGFTDQSMVQHLHHQDNGSCNWPRGGHRCCGTLRSPGVSHMGREDETDHCFPGEMIMHMCFGMLIRLRLIVWFYRS